MSRTFDILETMNNKSLETMSRLTHCITVINGWSGPALTQYGQERVELGGPVVSRWLAKIANYLTNELAADLFGTGEATPTRIYTTLQPWQDSLWQIAARAPRRPARRMLRNREYS